MKKIKKELGTSGIRPTAAEIVIGLNKISPMVVDQVIYRQMSKWIFAEDANCEIWITPRSFKITYKRSTSGDTKAPVVCKFKKTKVFQICLN